LDWLTMGQVLSIPMIVIGILLIVRSRQAAPARA
jgi:prolipoprotein diacylglyceryltransferase